jgi:hypothetical protein
VCAKPFPFLGRGSFFFSFFPQSRERKEKGLFRRVKMERKEKNETNEHVGRLSLDEKEK